VPETRIRPSSRRAPARRRDGAAAEGDAGYVTVVILYWPVCGHGLEDDEVLYDRPVCGACDAESRGRMQI
jgi:hypothetical protein